MDNPDQGDSTLSRLTAGSAESSKALAEDIVATLSARFHGLRRLGRGGMGEVFAGRDPLLKRDVAIKVLAGEYIHDEEARTRFVREAQAAAAVAHPNVVSIYHVGELQETHAPYFAMQFIEGDTLERAFPDGIATPESAARRVIAEVAAALGAAHARGLVHRDIKPSNVMVDPQTGRAIVLDFGISASVHDLGTEQRLTATGAYVGTPRYMSPEQASGSDATEKSDVYSLGCVAFELLTGRPVFQTRTVMEAFAAHLRDAAPLVSSIRPGIDRELDALVASCLEKDPARRPTALEIVKRLGADAGVLLEWPPPGLEHLQGAAARCTRAFAAGSAFTLLALLVLIEGRAALPSIVAPVSGGVAIGFAALGFALHAVSCRRLLATARDAAAAVRGGYAWPSVLEVMSDPTGESGDLITGSRRFGGLGAADRLSLRRGRVFSAVAALFAFALPVPIVVATLFLAGESDWLGSFVWWTLLVPATLLAAASVARRRETARAAPVRARKAARVTIVESAVAVWNQSFARARGTLRPVVLPSSISHARFAVVGLAALVLVTAVLCVPLAGTSALGASYWVDAMPKFANTKVKHERAQLWRHLELPKDAGITGLTAGRSYHALAPARDVVEERKDNPYRGAPWDSIPSATTDALFPAAPSVVFSGPDHQKILEFAARGVSGDQLAYLRRFAVSPTWRRFDDVAQAARVDFVGGRFIVPFPETTTWDQLPIPRFAATKTYAYASASRAAYHLATGRRDSAEFALRSVVSFGFAMADDGPTLIDNLIGVVIVSIGRDLLQRYYAIVGDERGAVLKVQVDSLNRAIDEASAASDPAPDDPYLLAGRDAGRARALVYAAAADIHQPRGLRYEMVAALALAPCSNLRELVFGPNDDVRSAFALARSQLAKSDGERALLDVIEQASVRRTPMPDSVSSVERSVVRASAALGALFRNRRFEVCARRWASNRAYARMYR